MEVWFEPQLMTLFVLWYLNDYLTLRLLLLVLVYNYMDGGGSKGEIGATSSPYPFQI